MNEPVQDARKQREKNAVQGSVAIVGGLALLIVRAISGIPVLGIVAGVFIAFIGWTLISGKSVKKPGESVQGAVLLLVGAVAAVAALRIPLLGSLSATALVVTGIGLMVYGGWKLWSFIRDANAR